MQTRQSLQQAEATRAVSQTHSPTNQQSPEPSRRSVHPTALIQRVMSDPKSLTRTEIFQLQRTIGNRAVGRLLGGELLGHKLAHVVQQRQGRVQGMTQAKGLIVNDDRALEQEADKIGEQIVSGAGASLTPSSGDTAATSTITSLAQPIQCKNKIDSFTASSGGSDRHSARRISKLLQNK
jgi:hypothetical protein